jgi:hypothetical protein
LKTVAAGDSSVWTTGKTKGGQSLRDALIGLRRGSLGDRDTSSTSGRSKEARETETSSTAGEAKLEAPRKPETEEAKLEMPTSGSARVPRCGAGG